MVCINYRPEDIRTYESLTQLHMGLGLPSQHASGPIDASVFNRRASLDCLRNLVSASPALLRAYNAAMAVVNYLRGRGNADGNAETLSDAELTNYVRARRAEHERTSRTPLFETEQQELENLRSSLHELIDLVRHAKGELTVDRHSGDPASSGPAVNAPLPREIVDRPTSTAQLFIALGLRTGPGGIYLNAASEIPVEGIPMSRLGIGELGRWLGSNARLFSHLQLSAAGFHMIAALDGDTTTLSQEDVRRYGIGLALASNGRLNATEEQMGTSQTANAILSIVDYFSRRRASETRAAPAPPSPSPTRAGSGVTEQPEEGSGGVMSALTAATLGVGIEYFLYRRIARSAQRGVPQLVSQFHIGVNPGRIGDNEGLRLPDAGALISNNQLRVDVYRNGTEVEYRLLEVGHRQGQAVHLYYGREQKCLVGGSLSGRPYSDARGSTILDPGDILHVGNSFLRFNGDPPADQPNVRPFTVLERPDVPAHILQRVPTASATGAPPVAPVYVSRLARTAGDAEPARPVERVEPTRAPDSPPAPSAARTMIGGTHVPPPLPVPPPVSPPEHEGHEDLEEVIRSLPANNPPAAFNLAQCIVLDAIRHYQFQRSQVSEDTVQQQVADLIPDLNAPQYESDRRLIARQAVEYVGTMSDDAYAEEWRQELAGHGDLAGRIHETAVPLEVVRWAIATTLGPSHTGGAADPAAVNAVQRERDALHARVREEIVNREAVQERYRESLRRSH